MSAQGHDRSGEVLVWAIVSDIHGNLEALQAVLADARAHQCEQIVCLGDTVGYGPNPIECVRLSMSWPIVLQGNFEAAVLSENDLLGWTAIAAARSVLWQRWLLCAQLKEYLASRPTINQVNDIWYVHGTPRNPLHEYVFPEDVWNQAKMERIAASFSRCCFNGHTHVPGIFVEDEQGEWTYLNPIECGNEFRLDRRKAICNVGSVGQPRDGDWRACYVLFDGELVRFRRVEYDIEATISKVYANPELDNFLGTRLRDGC